MNLSDKKVLLFDLDGTLADSSQDLAFAVNETIVKLGLSPLKDNLIKNWIGDGATVLIQRALSRSHIISNSLDPVETKRALEIFFNIYGANICAKTQLYKGVLETLTELKFRGYKLAIITNKPEKFISPILDALSLNDLFELILGGDTLERKKPDPFPLNFAHQYFTVHKNQCAMIGDSKNDILAAKAASIDSIAVTYGYNYGEDISNYKPELVITCFSELLTIFN